MLLVSRCLSAAGIRFSVIRCPPGDWAFLTVGLPDKPDPDGVTTFHTHELRPGWVPPVPRGRRCSPDRNAFFSRRLPLPNGQSLNPATASHPAGPLITRHQRRFTQFTPPVFPFACSPRMERAPLGFSPELRTPPAQYQQRTSGWGQAIEHEPEATFSTSADPPIQ